MLNIPLRNTITNYSFIVEIDDKVLTFKVDWNSREESWRMDILEAESTPIVQGLKLLPDQNLTKSYVDTRLPSGNLYILNSIGSTARPTYESLGDTQKLYYLTVEEEIANGLR